MSAEALSPFLLTTQIQHGTKTPAKAGGDAAAARSAAEDFEAQFLAIYAESMFSGIKTDGPFGGGHGETVFRSMLLQEYGMEMAQSGGVGITDQVYREILKLQEVEE